MFLFFGGVLGGGLFIVGVVEPPGVSSELFWEDSKVFFGTSSPPYFP